MSQIVIDFINLTKKRSNENEKSINILFEQGLIGNCISILRQELDTFIRIIYLGRKGRPIRKRKINELDLKWN